MKKIIITGIAGFAGSHLAEFLLKTGEVEVFGIDLAKGNRANIEPIRNKIKLYDCDMQDAEGIGRIIAEVNPDYISHLAAIATVGNSWEFPANALINNSIGQLNIFEAVRKLKINCRIQIACSSEEYGNVSSEQLPVNEDSPLLPLSPYAVSKVTQDLMGYQYYKSYGLKIIRTRSFNHAGPRSSDNFVLSNFAKQIALIEKGIKSPVICVGNLDAVRDFTDVRDVVCAYWLALNKCKPGEVYNICTGKGCSIRECLNLLVSLSQSELKIMHDPQRMRPSDLKVIYGDNRKLWRETGWKPKIKLQQTLVDLLNYWRDTIA